jgi:hypothetical protein
VGLFIYPLALSGILSYATPGFTGLHHSRHIADPWHMQDAAVLDVVDSQKAGLDRALTLRVIDRWRTTIWGACRYSSLPPEFLAALIANELYRRLSIYCKARVGAAMTTTSGGRP